MDDIGTIEENNSFILGFASKGVLLVDNTFADENNVMECDLLKYTEVIDEKEHTYHNIAIFGRYSTEKEEEQSLYKNLAKILTYQTISNETIDNNSNLSKISTFYKVENERKNYFNGIEDIVESYQYYLYFGYHGMQYLYLSNSKMNIMINYYGDTERQTVNIPAPYRPENVIGTFYKRNGNSSSWNIISSNINLQRNFSIKSNLEIGIFVDTMDFVYSNYDVFLYTNDVNGIIRDVGAIVSFDVKEM